MHDSNVRHASSSATTPATSQIATAAADARSAFFARLAATRRAAEASQCS
jgi:hypothetical protein